MALYVFMCPSCNEEYQFNWPMSQYDKNKKTVECITCGNVPLIRKIEKSNFHLKGYGWYRTNEVTQGIDPWSISDSEISKNKDDAERQTDIVQNQIAKGEN